MSRKGFAFGRRGALRGPAVFSGRHARPLGRSGDRPWWRSAVSAIVVATLALGGVVVTESLPTHPASADASGCYAVSSTPGSNIPGNLAAVSQGLLNWPTKGTVDLSPADLANRRQFIPAAGLGPDDLYVFDIDVTKTIATQYQGNIYLIPPTGNVYFEFLAPFTSTTIVVINFVNVPATFSTPPNLKFADGSIEPSILFNFPGVTALTIGQRYQQTFPGSVIAPGATIQQNVEALGQLYVDSAPTTPQTFTNGPAWLGVNTLGEICVGESGTPSPLLVADVEEVGASGTVTVSGTGFAPNSSVSIDFDPAGVAQVASSPVTTDSAGAFTALVDVDINAPDGPLVITATQASASLTANVTVEVVTAATPTPSISLSANSVQAGANITISGSGFPAGAVTLSGYNDTGATTNATVQPDGTFNQQVTIPGGTIAGAKNVTATSVQDSNIKKNITLTVTAGPTLNATDGLDTTFVPNDVITVNGSGFPAGAPITLTFTQGGQQRGTVNVGNADGSGNFNFTNVTLPSTVTPGDLLITATTSPGTQQATKTITVATPSFQAAAGSPFVPGAAVAITGKGYPANSSVDFTTSPATSTVTVSTNAEGVLNSASITAPPSQNGQVTISDNKGQSAAITVNKPALTADAQANPGSTITVSVSGFGPGNVDIDVPGGTDVYKVADANGAFTTTVEVPLGANGQLTLTASQSRPQPQGTLSATTNVNVTASVPGTCVAIGDPTSPSWTLPAGLGTVSASYASMRTTGSVTKNGDTTTFAGDGTSSPQVFNVSAGDLMNVYSFVFTGISKPGGGYFPVILNYSGTSLSFSGFNGFKVDGTNISSSSNDTVEDALAGALLWNMPAATTISLQANQTFYGTILAPTGTFTLQNPGNTGQFRGEALTTGTRNLGATVHVQWAGLEQNSLCSPPPDNSAISTDDDQPITPGRPFTLDGEGFNAGSVTIEFFDGSTRIGSPVTVTADASGEFHSLIEVPTTYLVGTAQKTLTVRATQGAAHLAETTITAQNDTSALALAVVALGDLIAVQNDTTIPSSVRSSLNWASLTALTNNDASSWTQAQIDTRVANINTAIAGVEAGLRLWADQYLTDSQTAADDAMTAADDAETLYLSLGAPGILWNPLDAKGDALITDVETADAAVPPNTVALTWQQLRDYAAPIDQATKALNTALGRLRPTDDDLLALDNALDAGLTTFNKTIPTGADPSGSLKKALADAIAAGTNAYADPTSTRTTVLEATQAILVAAAALEVEIAPATNTDLDEFLAALTDANLAITEANALQGLPADWLTDVNKAKTALQALLSKYGSRINLTDWTFQREIDEATDALVEATQKLRDALVVANVNGIAIDIPADVQPGDMIGVRWNLPACSGGDCTILVTLATTANGTPLGSATLTDVDGTNDGFGTGQVLLLDDVLQGNGSWEVTATATSSSGTTTTKTFTLKNNFQPYYDALAAAGALVTAKGTYPSSSSSLWTALENVIATNAFTTADGGGSATQRNADAAETQLVDAMRALAADLLTNQVSAATGALSSYASAVGANPLLKSIAGASKAAVEVARTNAQNALADPETPYGTLLEVELVLRNAIAALNADLATVSGGQAPWAPPSGLEPGWVYSANSLFTDSGIARWIGRNLYIRGESSELEGATVVNNDLSQIKATRTSLGETSGIEWTGFNYGQVTIGSHIDGGPNGLALAVCGDVDNNGDVNTNGLSNLDGSRNAIHDPNNAIYAQYCSNNYATDILGHMHSLSESFEARSYIDGDTNGDLIEDRLGQFEDNGSTLTLLATDAHRDPDGLYVFTVEGSALKDVKKLIIDGLQVSDPKEPGHILSMAPAVINVIGDAPVVWDIDEIAVRDQKIGYEQIYANGDNKWHKDLGIVSGALMWNFLGSDSPNSRVNSLIPDQDPPLELGWAAYGDYGNELLHGNVEPAVTIRTDGLGLNFLGSILIANGSLRTTNVSLNGRQFIAGDWVMDDIYEYVPGSGDCPLLYKDPPDVFSGGSVCDPDYKGGGNLLGHAEAHNYPWSFDPFFAAPGGSIEIAKDVLDPVAANAVVPGNELYDLFARGELRCMHVENVQRFGLEITKDQWWAGYENYLMVDASWWVKVGSTGITIPDVPFGAECTITEIPGLFSPLDPSVSDGAWGRLREGQVATAGYQSVPLGAYTSVPFGDEPVALDDGFAWAVPQYAFDGVKRTPFVTDEGQTGSFLLTTQSSPDAVTQVTNSLAQVGRASITKYIDPSVPDDERLAGPFEFAWSALLDGYVKDPTGATHVIRGSRRGTLVVEANGVARPQFDPADSSGTPDTVPTWWSKNKADRDWWTANGDPVPQDLWFPEDTRLTWSEVTDSIKIIDSTELSDGYYDWVPEFEPNATVTVPADTDPVVAYATNTLVKAPNKFTVAKSIVGTGASAVPEDATFTIGYKAFELVDEQWVQINKCSEPEAPEGCENTLSVRADGTPAPSVVYPPGTRIELEEVPPAPAPGITWGTPTYGSTTTTLDNQNGFVIEDNTRLDAITVTNKAIAAPSFSLYKSLGWYDRMLLSTSPSTIPFTLTYAVNNGTPQEVPFTSNYGKDSAKKRIDGIEIGNVITISETDIDTTRWDPSLMTITIWDGDTVLKTCPASGSQPASCSFQITDDNSNQIVVAVTNRSKPDPLPASLMPMTGGAVAVWLALIASLALAAIWGLTRARPFRRPTTPGGPMR